MANLRKNISKVRYFGYQHWKDVKIKHSGLFGSSGIND